MVLMLAACGYVGWRYVSTRAADAAVDPKSSAQSGPPPIPVTFSRVQLTDFPVYLNGLGTVQAYNTVTVRSRVDGEITKIAFKEGQIVKEGDLLVQIDPRPFQAALDQATAKKAQDEASLRNAQLDLKRFTDLARQDFASRQQVDTQQAQVDQFTAQIKGDQAAVDNAKTQLSYTTINAPLSGRIGFRLVDQGNIVHASDTNGMLSIVQLQPISVVFTAPEEEVPRINKALAAGPVPVTALSSDGSRTLSEGKLDLVDNTVDQASGTIRMKATFENKDNVLWPGLSVSTRLLVDTLKSVAVIPNDAVERGPNGLYAFVIDDANKVAMHDIKVSEAGASQSVVSQGLSPGEKVVVAGQYRLQEGSTVAPNEAATSPAAPTKEAQNTPEKAP
ncbi:MAG: efflux RND transporter periplasmic adaptor subunit [Hyphomicrobiales bacterium]|nr:efflux RND transporter periplasmic adaptor subunit [Hyphomicrobiales bacterium]MBV9430413.1 efflux RND transporter periplasmic adaptor subunit [Hyphomicrobiales bacterium]